MHRKHVKDFEYILQERVHKCDVVQCLYQTSSLVSLRRHLRIIHLPPPPNTSDQENIDLATGTKLIDDTIKTDIEACAIGDFGATLSQASLSGLLPGNWLNDEVINAILGSYRRQGNTVLMVSTNVMTIAFREAERLHSNHHPT